MTVAAFSYRAAMSWKKRLACSRLSGGEPISSMISRLARRKALKVLAEPSVLLRRLQFEDQIGGGREAGPQARTGGLMAQGDGEMGLADARRPQEDDILLARHEGQGGESLDLTPWSGGDEGEIIILNGLYGGKPRHAGQQLGGPGAPEIALGDQRLLGIRSGCCPARRRGSPERANSPRRQEASAPRTA